MMYKRSDYKRLDGEDLTESDLKNRSKYRSSAADGFDPDKVEFSQSPKSRNDQWTKGQFEKPKRATPIKSIILAIALFLVGTILLLCGCLIHVGHVDNEKYGDRLWPLIIFGLLMFIPGSYHVYIVVNVFLGKPGYTFDEFPQFDD